MRKIKILFATIAVMLMGIIIYNNTVKAEGGTITFSIESEESYVTTSKYTADVYVCISATASEKVKIQSAQFFLGFDSESLAFLEGIGLLESPSIDEMKVQYKNSIPSFWLIGKSNNPIVLNKGEKTKLFGVWFQITGEKRVIDFSITSNSYAFNPNSVRIGLESQVTQINLNNPEYDSSLARINKLEVTNGSNALELMYKQGELEHTGFNDEVFEYYINVPHDTTSLAVTALAKHGGKILTTGLDAVEIDRDDKVILVTVQSRNEEKKQEYQINVHRLSNDATLTSFTVNEKEIDVKSSSKLWAVIEDGTINTVDLEFNTNNEYAKVEVKGATRHPVSGKWEVSIKDELNLFTVIVTAEDKTTKTYDLTIDRYSNLAYLQNITVDGTGIANFNASKYEYEIVVDNTDDKISLGYVLGTDCHYIAGNFGPDLLLGVGTNTFTCEVMSEDGLNKVTYTVTVVRLENLFLSSLEVYRANRTEKAGDLSPEFSSEVTEYTISIDYDVTEIYFKYETISSNVTNDIASSYTITDNQTKITFKIMQNYDAIEYKQAYEIVVIRKANTILDRIELQYYDASGAIIQTSSQYFAGNRILRISPKANVERVVFEAKALDPSAVITYTGATDFTFDDSNHAVIFINVRARDSEDNTVYRVVFERELSTNTTLERLVFDVSESSKDGNIYYFDLAVGTLSLGVTAKCKTGQTIRIGYQNAPLVSTSSENFKINNLQPGSNVFLIEVTAQDKITTSTYELRIEVSKSSLKDIEEIFTEYDGAYYTATRNNTTYTLEVPYQADTIQLQATISENSTLLIDDSTSMQIELSPVINGASSTKTVTLKIIAQDETYTEYTLNIVRRANDIAEIQSIKIRDTEYKFSIADPSNPYYYSVVVPTTQTNISLKFTFTSQSEGASAITEESYDISNANEMEITVIVTSAYATTSTYYLNIIRSDASTYLSKLIFSYQLDGLQEKNIIDLANFSFYFTYPSGSTDHKITYMGSSGETTIPVSFNQEGGYNLYEYDVFKFYVKYAKATDSTINELKLFDSNGKVVDTIFTLRTNTFSTSVKNGINSVKFTNDSVKLSNMQKIGLMVDERFNQFTDNYFFDLSGEPKDYTYILRVYAEDTNIFTDYVLKITKNPKSNENEITKLTMKYSDGNSIDLEFNDANNAYLASVPYEIDKVQLYFEVSENATVTILSNPVDPDTGYEALLGAPVATLASCTVIRAVVTAESSYQTTYDIRITREFDTNNEPTKFTYTLGTVNKEILYMSGTNEYSVKVGYEVSELTIEMNGKPETASANTEVIKKSLVVGENIYYFVVTSQSGEENAIYIKVIRDIPDEDASIKRIEFRNGDTVLQKANYIEETNSYSLKVAFNITYINVTVELNSTTSVVLTDISRFDLSLPEFMKNAIDVFSFEVKVQSGKIFSYSIRVERETEDISSITAIQTPEYVILNPAFNPEVLEYSFSVVYDIKKISLMLQCSQYAMINGSFGELNDTMDLYEAKKYVFSYICTSQSGSETEYRITVTREQNTEADLIEVKVSGTNSSYLPDEDNIVTINVDYLTASQKLEFVISGDATMTNVSGEFLYEAPTSSEPKLTSFKITVTSQDAQKRQEYTINVYRAPDSRSYLKDITVSDGCSFTTPFQPDVLEYTVEVGNSIATLVFTAVLDDDHTYTVDNKQKILYEIFTDRQNKIFFTVTAQDGSSSTYNITIVRGKNTDTSFTRLTIVAAGKLYQAIEIDGKYYLEEELEYAVSSVQISLDGLAQGATYDRNKIYTLNAPTREACSTTIVTFNVIAENESFSKEYEIEIYRKRDSRAYISEIILPDGVAINPLFLSNITKYTVIIPYTMESLAIEVNPLSTAYVENKTITYSFNRGESKTYTFTIESQDGETNVVYEFVATRELSKDISIDEFAILDANNKEYIAQYNSITKEYDVIVPFQVNRFKIKLSFLSPNCSIHSILEYTLSEPTSLEDVRSKFTIRIMAEDGHTYKDEILCVTRLREDINTISNVILDEGFALNETITDSTTTYTIDVDYDVNMFRIMIELKGERSTASQLQITQNVHVNSRFEFTVTAQNGDSKVYVFLVTLRSNTNCTYSTIILVNQNNTVFIIAYPSKKLLVNYESEFLALSSSIIAQGATLNFPAKIDLNKPTDEGVATTNFTFSITSANGQNTEEYEIEVTRSQDSLIEFDGFNLSENPVNPISFNKNVYLYNVIVDYSISSLSISLNLDTQSTIKCDTPTLTKELVSGSSVDFIFDILSQDGEAKLTYTVRVFRDAANSDSTVRLLQVEGYALSPMFSRNERNYTIEIDKKTTQLNIMAEANSEFATVSNTGKISLDTSLANEVISIVCTAQDGSTTTYNITIVKTSGLNLGALIGGGAGGVVGLAAIAILVIVLLKKKKNKAVEQGE